MLESTRTQVEGLSALKDMGIDPASIWHALNEEGRDPPAELRELHGVAESTQQAGWLARRWRAAPAAAASNVCDNSWVASWVGNEAAFPAAEDHFLRLDRWDDAGSFYGGYNQYAGWVDLWHGGICLEQEVPEDDFVPPGTAWYLWYYRYGEFTLRLVTPTITVLPGEAHHWIWTRCGSCTPWYWRQVAATNPGNLIRFDMGMDWTFCRKPLFFPRLFPVCE